MEIKNFTITRRDGSRDSFAVDKIMNAIVKAFDHTKVPTDLGTISKIIGHLNIEKGMLQDEIQDEIERALLREGNRHDRRVFNQRPATERMCALMPDNRVISLLKKIGIKLRRYYGNPLQLFTCFLLAFYALIKTESRGGKIAHYWELLVRYMKGYKIPALRTLQDAIKKLSCWQTNTMTWLLSKADRIKYKAWSTFQGMIENMLPKLEPAFIVVS